IVCQAAQRCALAVRQVTPLLGEFLGSLRRRNLSLMLLRRRRTAEGIAIIILTAVVRGEGRASYPPKGPCAGHRTKEFSRMAGGCARGGGPRPPGRPPPQTCRPCLRQRRVRHVLPAAARIASAAPKFIPSRRVSSGGISALGSGASPTATPNARG